jgi:hypothetical protein
VEFVHPSRGSTFSIEYLCDVALWYEDRIAMDVQATIATLLDFLKRQLTALGREGTQAARKLEERIDTVAFKIRLPLPSDPSCNQTPMRDRWIMDPESYLKEGDPRAATEDECMAMKAMLLAKACMFEGVEQPDTATRAVIEQVLGDSYSPGAARCIQTGETLRLTDLVIGATMSTYMVGSAELPVEYQKPLTCCGLHEAKNIGWLRPPTEIIAVRTFLAQKDVPGSLLNKVQLKAYSTDKQTMPPFFSNRDYRWATWVESPQFASRTDCRGVELQLLAQILEFVDAPRLSDEERRQVEHHLGRELVLNSCHCPITGDPLVYKDFEEAAKNPQAGKSEYHVGHLNPLTRGGKHVKENVVWMSDAGNRIQGNDTFDEIVALIQRAAAFHQRRCQPPSRTS